MKQGDKTKRKILDAGVKLWPSCNAHEIGKKIELTHSAILYHFKTVDALRLAIADHAVKIGASRVIMQLIAIDHPSIANMSSLDRSRHIDKAQR